MNIGISNKYLIIREINRGNCRTRVFIKYDHFYKPVHISFLFKDHLYGVLFTKDIVEYSIPRESLPFDFELYEVIDCDSRYIMLNHVFNNNIVNLGVVDRETDLSSGFNHIDILVNEITWYRKQWSKNLCETVNAALFYSYFLKADTVLKYVLTGRLKDTWLELSNEYIAFIYSIIHSALIRFGFKPRDKRVLEEKCLLASRASNVSWRNISIQYTNSGKTLNIFLEKMIYGVSPDILISSMRKNILIECKQGPPRTWFMKAVKQSSRYRRIADIISLITPRELSKEEVSDLMKFYQHVIDQCNPANKSRCIDRVNELISYIIDS
ncbi:MAG: hypothetical protein QXE81_04620 [Desulfurococcaceae archaeon]